MLSIVPASPTPSLHDLGDLRAGNLEVIVAERGEDIEAAQCLRYRVFFDEMGAVPRADIACHKRDADAFDAVCDHLVVVEHRSRGRHRVVGTYRLLRREAMKSIGKFYSDGEYDLAPIHNYPGEILEVGRSCVDAEYRNRAVMQLLWRGIGAYVACFNIELMFGCASFPGTDPLQHAAALSFLHHYHIAPEALRPSALPGRFVDMNLMPKEAVDVRKAFALLPALIKGYLRLGGYVGLGAVVDPEYNTTDVSIVVKTDLVTDKYIQRYGKSDS
ncbi:MAG: GNAT family N-acetyltransferase [Pseudomonadota bacterium]|nr:GNAT family N-acetyltransferase [Pseudomonadota bacterium]MDE3038840.1 GNAT family N-acetyltransferase [Pseudomonadota bacterium]